MMVSAVVRGDLAEVLTFVVAVAAEGDGEGLQVGDFPGGVMKDCGGIETTGGPDTEGDIADEMFADGGAEERVEFFFGFFEGAGLRFEAELPPGVAIDVAITPFEKFAGKEFLKAFDQGVGSWDIVEGEEVGEAIEVEAARDFGVEEDGLKLGAEVEVAATVEEVKGLDAHAVAGEDEALSFGVPESDGEHAAEM